MKNHSLFTLPAAVLLSLQIIAQPPLPPRGMFTPEEINMTQCSFDKEADAVILLDEAVTNYDDEHRMITRRRIRIKILNEKGINRADVVIPFYTRDNFEYVHKVEATTYNPAGNNTVTFVALDKKSIFTEKTDSYHSRIKFAMPSVKEGSILEYSYESIMKHYGGLDEWRFQSDLPTVRSCFLLHVLPTAEFAYQVQKKNTYRIEIKSIPDEGRVYFEMNNIPGLRFEPYMDAVRDYIQKVSFQLSGILNVFGSKQNINTNWKTVTNELMSDKEFGSHLDKDLKLGEIKQIAEKESGTAGKAKAIYDYFVKNFSWNGYNSKYAPDGLKTVWERKKGTSGELNLLLINLMKTADVEVYPVLVADRDFGKVDTLYPYLDRFNKVVALVYAGNAIFILDASEQHCPFGLTPYSLLNTTGFLVDKKKLGFVKILSGKSVYGNKIHISGILNEEGQLSSTARIESRDYAKQLRTGEIEKNRQHFIKDFFEKSYEGLDIDSFSIHNTNRDSMYLLQDLKFRRHYSVNGGLLLLHYNMFMGVDKNPFISDIRFTNVNFGYPVSTEYQADIVLPEGSKIEGLPPAKTILNPEFGIRLIREMRNEDGKISISVKFTQTVTLVTAERYGALKDFYKQITDLLNEPVLVKLNN